MASVTLTSNWDLRSFRTGLTEMKTEGARFRDTFKKGIESGGGLFGSIDKGLGSLASGRFAAPIAAIGAALTVARVATDLMAKQWENMAASTDRTLQNIEAIQATRQAVSGQKYAGDAATRDYARSTAETQDEAAYAAREAGSFGDPAAVSIAGLKAMANAAKELGGGGFFSGAYQFNRILAGRVSSAVENVPGLGQLASLLPFKDDFEEVNKLYNDRQGKAQQTRNEAERAAQLKPFVDYANETTQRSAQAGLIGAEDRLGVAQGRTTAYEAAANQLLLANAQFQSTKALYGENDPRTQQAQAAALNAFTTYDTELTQARRFRNDPTIAADSLARLGGGGGVNVFGDGRGELLFEQKRLNQSTQQLIGVMRELTVTLSRQSANDVR